jgi:DNA-binding protein HU-beta
MPAKRTTHRSTKGTKLYAVRDSKGRFKDIQTYQRAHAMDIKRSSKAEAAKVRRGGKKGR